MSKGYTFTNCVFWMSNMCSRSLEKLAHGRVISSWTGGRDVFLASRFLGLLTKGLGPWDKFFPTEYELKGHVCFSWHVDVPSWPYWEGCADSGRVLGSTDVCVGQNSTFHWTMRIDFFFYQSCFLYWVHEEWGPKPKQDGCASVGWGQHKPVQRQVHCLIPTSKRHNQSLMGFGKIKCAVNGYIQV